MQNSMVFSFSVLDWKCLFSANLVQKIKIINLSLNFGTETNLNTQNSMKMFTFSVFYWKYSIWINLL